MGFSSSRHTNGSYLRHANNGKYDHWGNNCRRYLLLSLIGYINRKRMFYPCLQCFGILDGGG